MVRLISLKQQKIDGSRELKADETFTVSSQTIANYLVKAGRAKYADESAKKSGRYQRRDLRPAH